MANLTKAQRYNKMFDDVFETYRQQEHARQHLIPSCSDYTYFLNESIKRLEISIEDARNKYGLYTYGQWKELLKLA